MGLFGQVLTTGRATGRRPSWTAAIWCVARRIDEATRLQHAQDYGQGALQVQVPLVLSRRVQNMRQDGRHSHLQVEQTAEKILITKHVVISKKNFKTKVKSIPWPNQSTSSCSLFFLPFFLSFSIFREPTWLHWHPSMGHYYTTMVGRTRCIWHTDNYIVTNL